MRTLFDAILGGIAAAAALAATSAACAQPAAAPVPMTAASRALQTRSTAITAAENAKEPGNQRPEERVIPQISIPLKSRSSTAATAASAPPARVPGGVNADAARCLAIGNASEKAACERALAASGPVKPGR